jgi:hypothetical protein
MTEEEKKTKPTGEENLDPEEFEEDEEGKKPDDKGGEPAKTDPDNPNPTKSKEELEKEQRAEFARKRREKEAKEKAEKERLAHEEQLKKEAATKAELDLVKTNPYTEEPIVDEYDLEVYKIQKKLEAEGKDPIKDLPKALANREREQGLARQKELKDKEVIDKQLKVEIADLRKKYPDVNTRDLGNDPLFLEISEEKEGRWTMTELYEEYLKRKDSGSTSKTAKEGEGDDPDLGKAAKKITKQPSSNPGGKPLKENPMEMSDEEFIKAEADKKGDFF